MWHGYWWQWLLGSFEFLATAVFTWRIVDPVTRRLRHDQTVICDCWSCARHKRNHQEVRIVMGEGDQAFSTTVTRAQYRRLKFDQWFFGYTPSRAEGQARTVNGKRGM